MAKPRKLTEPEKELRFTRSLQAYVFWGGGTVCLCLAAAFGLLSWPAFMPRETPMVPAWLALVPLVFVPAFFWVATHLTRHAFLLLTPVGVEIFPLFFPAKNFNLVFWQEIENLEVDPRRRQLTISQADGGKIFVSLAPIAATQRELLASAVEGAMEKRQANN